MDIRINGDLLSEPALSRMASFSDLMNDLNRMIGSRKEIITEVRADGREILSWDITELDMPRIQRLDIATQPVREFAVASLGDLGDYAGEVLSVLRNVESICNKEGYPHLRQKLVDGLNYILTVIESSSKVLDINLAEAHYDVRTGAQMMMELVSLKNRLVSSPDFGSARKHLSELEFTLVDWLKFLETLLQKYGEQQSEVGEIPEIVEEARSHVERLDRLQSDLKAIVEDLYGGRVAKSMDLFHTRIQVLQSSLAYLERLRGLGRVSYESLAVEGHSLAGKIPQVTEILKELTESIRIGDTVLMRDLLEYEILPFIAFIRQIYEKIAANAEKG